MMFGPLCPGKLVVIELPTAMGEDLKYSGGMMPLVLPTTVFNCFVMLTGFATPKF